jgi:hypothetical protein
MPFLILLMGFFGTSFWKKYEDRRELDKELWHI